MTQLTEPYAIAADFVLEMIDAAFELSVQSQVRSR